jgi:uncharacterized membrane protein
MGDILRDRLVRATLLSIIALILAGLALVIYELLNNLASPKPVNLTPEQAYGWIIGGIFAVGWGLVFPLLLILRRRDRAYTWAWYHTNSEIEEIVNAAQMYLRGTISKEEFIQILDRIKNRGT